MDKKGYSVGFTWIFGLVTIFGLGVLYIVFSQVFEAHLVPTIQGMVNSSTIDPTTQATINAGIGKYMKFFHLMPYVLIFVVIIYMLVAAFRKEGVDQYS